MPTRRRLGALRASAPTAIATALSAANYRQQNAAANRDFCDARARPRRPTPPISSPLTPDGFLPLIDTELEGLCRAPSASRGEVGGWKADLSIGYGHNSFDYEVRDSLNTSFGTASQSDVRRRRPALRPDRRQPRFLARISRSASPSRCRSRVGAEYRHENFKIRPGDLQSYAIGPLFRASITTTAANCAAQQRRVQRRRPASAASPAAPRPAGAQGFPGIPDHQRDRREPPQLGRPMSSSTPIRSRASPPRSPAATSISPTSATP